MRRAALLVAVLVSAAFAGGCGDSQDTSATTEWADGVCSAFSTWTSSVGAAARSFTTATPSQEGLETAVGDVKDATSTFADDLKGLGAADTESGEKAKDELDGLADDL